MEEMSALHTGISTSDQTNSIALWSALGVSEGTARNVVASCDSHTLRERFFPHFLTSVSRTGAWSDA